MRWASNAAADAIHVLVAFRTVFGKVNAGAKHATDVCVPFVETLLHDRIDEWTAME